MKKPDYDAVNAALRARLRSTDEAIGVPPELWERIRVPAPAPRSGARAPSPALLVALAAVLVAAVALGSWWLARPGTDRPMPPAGSKGVTTGVYNAEAGCQELHTMECALRLAKDPHKKYSAAGNRAGLAWHGDRVTARCVISDGVMVRDESGITSARWYLVSTEAGQEGWLPGVRTRNAAEVPDCVSG